MKDLNLKRNKERLIKIAIDRHDTYKDAAEALGITTRALLFIRKDLRDAEQPE
jgi:hypothetical protein